MRRILALVVVGLVVVLIGVTEGSKRPLRSAQPTLHSAVLSQQGQEETDPAKITVYVTRTGTKYHRDGCRYLRKSKIPMSLKEAAKTYSPCSVCKPPRLPEKQ